MGIKFKIEFAAVATAIDQDKIMKLRNDVSISMEISSCYKEYGRNINIGRWIRRMPPKLSGFYHYQRHIYNPVEHLRWTYFAKIVKEGF